MGVLEGKVVLITGGGRGIGRECALAAAREGAAVLVNDLGSSLGGTAEAGANPAEEVAAEIRAMGGNALANTDSITDLPAVRHMVDQAVQGLGGLHAVVNTAGILRDVMFHKMTEEDWDTVVSVHLRGSFNVAHATVNHFRQQQDGAYVFFTSTSALVGNLAQSNYAAAKLGIVGLSRILAMEGASKGIRSNVLAPLAWTRMIASIPVKDEAAAERVARIREGMRAEQVAPLVVALAAEGAAEVNGQIFCVRGNELVLFSQPRPIKSVARVGGWDAASILETALPAMRASFFDLVPSAAIFPYDPP